MAGVAIGLAAQTIVKDMINGMLVLVEDQYNVGDWVTIAGVTGTVDSMSLRKTTVRGGDGTLYLIPNSQITIVANQSRDFSTTTLNISVDFSANPDKVIALLTKVSDEVRQEPAYKDIFLEDPKVLGVDQIKGSEVIYPITVKTLARKQFDALREMQRRIRIALEENNMLPGSPFRITGGKSLAAPGEQVQAAAGARSHHQQAERDQSVRRRMSGIEIGVIVSEGPALLSSHRRPQLRHSMHRRQAMRTLAHHREACLFL